MSRGVDQGESQGRTDREGPGLPRPGLGASIFDIGQAEDHQPPAPPHWLLIAEDHDGMRATLAEIMRAEGYQVMEARDGQVALDALSASPVDVLILDLNMPRVNGMEVLRQLDAPPPMVIVYSAFASYTPEELVSKVGSKVFRSLQKPVAPPRLVSAVADAIAELGRKNE